MPMKFLVAILLLLLPNMAQAADVTGVPKIRDGDQIQIGNSKIRLGGIDAPSVDQLCLNNTGERWTCGVAARDELTKHAGNKSWTCHTQRTDRRGRQELRRGTRPRDPAVVGPLWTAPRRGPAVDPRRSGLEGRDDPLPEAEEPAGADLSSLGVGRCGHSALPSRGSSALR